MVFRPVGERGDIRTHTSGNNTTAFEYKSFLCFLSELLRAMSAVDEEHSELDKPFGDG